MKYLLFALLLAIPLGAQSEPDMAVPATRALKPPIEQYCAKPYKMYKVYDSPLVTATTDGTWSSWPAIYPVCLKPEFYAKLKEAYEASVR